MGTSGTGMIKILVFLILLLLIFWSMNIYKHVRAGWRKSQKVYDIIGEIMLIAILIVTVLPLFKK